MTPAQQYQAALAKPAKPRKYRNQPIEIDGIRYDSKAEAKRGMELDLLAKAGEIGSVFRQARFPLNVNGQLICTYIADFVYDRKADSETIVEDVKSPATRSNPAYRIKRKLMKAIHGIDITEVP